MIIKLKQTVQYLVLGILFMFSVSDLYGQQEPQYSQFMYNKLPINAGYTGSREVLSLRALYRNQWSGITGAPQTATFSIHSPLKKEASALGFYMINDRLGVTNQTYFDASYAYRVPLGKGVKLSIGLNAGLLWFKSNLMSLKIDEQQDLVFQQNVNKVLPDIGAGLYIYHKNAYFGFSVPNFIKGDLQDADVIKKFKNDNSGSFLSAHRTAHFVTMAGGVIPAGKVLFIRPQIMYRYIASAEQKIAHTLDMNLSLLIYNRVNIGASYRTSFHNKSTGLLNGDSFDALIEVWPTKQLLIGFAYDYTLTKLGDYSHGSYDIILGYDFSFEKKRIITPRYF
ncbi:MAG TPA: type IX secretion system membrane protein PorP/SprF [Chitinophagales bacterium]|nr:type IX secretion system membrane protein PorP/SprF [Chitinophagales bacterium]